MKRFLILVVIAAAAYYAWGHYGGLGEPVYAEIRVKHADVGIELLGLGRMNSDSDCQARAERFWKKIFASEQRFQIVSAQCTHQISPRLRDLFANRPYHATYLSLERGNSGERDGRFVFFGAPSSEVQRICPTLVQQLKQNYAGKVECVPGTVG